MEITRRRRSPCLFDRFHPDEKGVEFGGMIVFMLEHWSASEWFCRGSIPRWDCATIYGRYPAALHLWSFQWIVYYVTVDSAKHENLGKVGTRFLLVHLSLFSSTTRTLLHSTTPSHTLTLYLPICPFLRRLCNNTRLITANISGMTLTMSSGLCAFLWTGSLQRHLRIFVSNQSCFSNTLVHISAFARKTAGIYEMGSSASRCGQYLAWFSEEVVNEKEAVVVGWRWCCVKDPWSIDGLLNM